MTLFEMNPELYIQKYIYGKSFKPNRAMGYGKMMAEGLETDEATGDMVLDMMMSRLPKFELMDKVVEMPGGVEVYDPNDKKTYTVPFLQNGKEKIPLLAKPDSMKTDLSAIKEYKLSGRKWTDKMVHESGQITFYATAIWLITGKIPQDMELVVVRTKKTEGGNLIASGELWRCATQRKTIDIIKMTSRIKKAWAGIQELCEKEVL